MTLRFRTEPEASTELGEAALWYERRRPGLGADFLDAVDTALEFISQFPAAGESMPDVPPELEIRRIPVRRFPFHIAYLGPIDDVIRILAFAHDRRSPGYWHSRVPS